MCGRCGSCGKSACLSVISFGLAWGLTAAVFTIAFAWASMVWGVGAAMIDLMASLYYGYAATWVGGLWGGLWAFIEGYVVGVIFACLYNAFQCCGKSSKPCSEKCQDECNSAVEEKKE